MFRFMVGMGLGFALGVVVMRRELVQIIKAIHPAPRPVKEDRRERVKR